MVTLHPPVVGAYCSTSVKHETPERVRGLQCAVLSNIAAAPLYKYTSADIVKIFVKTLQCDPGSSGTRSRAEQPGESTHPIVEKRPSALCGAAAVYGVFPAGVKVRGQADTSTLDPSSPLKRDDRPAPADDTHCRPFGGAVCLPHGLPSL